MQMKIYTTIINHEAIKLLSFADLTALRTEVEEQINLTEIKFGEAVSEHKDELTNQLTDVLQRLDIHVAERLSDYFKIEMPNGSDALLHRPK